MQELIKAAEKGDVNGLKDIMETNPGYVNARFSYEYKVFKVTYYVSFLYIYKCTYVARYGTIYI